MTMKQSKKILLILTMVFMVPFLWNQSTAVASAATPKLSKSKVSIVGEEETYQLTVKNKVSGSTYKWSTSNSKVAKVSSKGVITSVNKGTATIKCKITYPTKKTKTLSCKVTVTIPATKIRINNAKEVNNTHTMLVGESYDFNRDIVPSNSSDKTFWFVDERYEDLGIIRIDNSSNGKITAMKEGKTILVAKAAKKATKEEADKSIVDDSIIIEVVKPSATVGSAEIIGANEIRVVFDSPVDSGTIIGTNGALLSNIKISMSTNVKGVMAKDPGELTATLADDKKTLTIVAKNMFDGEYIIDFTSNIKTVDGTAITPYYKRLTYIDTTPPTLTGISLDDTGMNAIINFSEAMNFGKLKVSNAKVVPNSNYSSTVQAETISILNNELNYIASEDKKSLSINLSNISSSDYNKTFQVIISGVTDLAGNRPADYTLSAFLRTDTTPKAQARPTSVVRTSYDTITATFSRAIKEPGWMTIDSGSSIDGVVDSKNNKKVNYKLSEFDANLSGTHTVSIGYWDSYNVKDTDTYAQTMREFKVYFTVDKTAPYLVKYEFDPETGILTLIYNEAVDPNMDTGIFTSTLETITDDIRSGTNITYTKVASDDEKEIKLKMGNMSVAGKYTFNLEKGFAIDKYKNMSLERTLTLSNTSNVNNELPGPYSVQQSETDLSQIKLEFSTKLDVTSAEIPTNYSIPGVTIRTAKVTNNTDSGATVTLTVVDGTIAATVEYPITISGVKGYKGSYTAISTYTTDVMLKDNKKPYFVSPLKFNKNEMNVIELNFNEEIKGDMTVEVTQSGATSREIGNTITVSGNTVYIRLDEYPDNNTSLRVRVIENKITDLNGNESTPINSYLYVTVKY